MVYNIKKIISEIHIKAAVMLLFMALPLLFILTCSGDLLQGVDEIFSGNTELVFEMGNLPNEKWGSSADSLPPTPGWQ